MLHLKVNYHFCVSLNVPVVIHMKNKTTFGLGEIIEVDHLLIERESMILLKCGNTAEHNNINCCLHYVELHFPKFPFEKLLLYLLFLSVVAVRYQTTCRVEEICNGHSLMRRKTSVEGQQGDRTHVKVLVL